MNTITTAESGYDTISLQEAKKHLRIFSDNYDNEVTAALAGAIDWAERYSSRTLRTAVSRETSVGCWAELDGKALPWQPVIGVANVKYFDQDGDEQTLSASAYRVIASTHGGTRIELNCDVSLPAIARRSDAITVEYTTGYNSVASIPPLAKSGIKLKMTVLYGDLDPREVEAWNRQAEECLNSIDWSPL